jgi:hypothetical protein
LDDLGLDRLGSDGDGHEASPGRLVARAPTSLLPMIGSEQTFFEGVGQDFTSI